MTFTFPRVSAGLYEIQLNNETVGFIRKQNASKWIVVDVVDTPQHVSKTLKDAKYAVDNFIKFDAKCQGVDNTSESEYNHSVKGERVNLELNKTLEDSLNVYTINTEELKEKEVSSDIFGPTLEPIEF